MVLFFSGVLVVSIIGMLSLLLLKRWELTSGHVLGGSARPKVGALAHRVLSWFEYRAPMLVRGWVQHAYHYAQTFLHRAAALSVLLLERGLERFLKLLRRKTAIPRSDVEASAFLREVSAHKKQLIKGTRKQRSIYED